MAKRGLWIGLAAAAVALFVGAYVASPILAYDALKDAARSGDRDRLDQVVDFPAVRENLKSEISTGMMKSVRSDPKLRDNPFAALGALLLPAITDRVVDAVITPDGIATIINQGRASKTDAPPPPADPASPSAAQPSPARPRLVTRYGYQGLDRFVATITRADQPDQPVTLTLARRGLFSWKLVRIDLPPTAFSLGDHPG